MTYSICLSKYHRLGPTFGKTFVGICPRKTKTTGITSHINTKKMNDNQIPSSNSTTISDRMQSSLNNRYSTKTHARLIAELVSVQKQPHTALSSPEFWALQNFFFTSAQIVDDIGFVIARQNSQIVSCLSEWPRRRVVFVMN